MSLHVCECLLICFLLSEISFFLLPHQHSYTQMATLALDTTAFFLALADSQLLELWVQALKREGVMGPAQESGVHLWSNQLLAKKEWNGWYK